MAHIPLIIAAFGFGGQELMVILVICLLLFGGAKLPSLAKGLGQAVREFKVAANDFTKDAKESDSIHRKN